MRSDRLMIPITPPSRCAVLGRVEPELVGLPGKALHGRHEKAPVRCPCSRLAALHGAPRTPFITVVEYQIKIYVMCFFISKSVAKIFMMVFGHNKLLKGKLESRISTIIKNNK